MLRKKLHQLSQEYFWQNLSGLPNSGLCRAKFFHSVQLPPNSSVGGAGVPIITISRAFCNTTVCHKDKIVYSQFNRFCITIYGQLIFLGQFLTCRNIYFNIFYFYIVFKLNPMRF